MEKTTLTQIGYATSKGGLNIYMEELTDFLSKWPGKKVMATFTILGSPASEAIKTYYRKGIVPQMRQALYMSEGTRKTDKQTDEYLREISPVATVEDWNENTNSWNHKILEIDEMTNPQLSRHIDFIKQLAAEEYQIFINDPTDF